jgi:hypothetical protein
MSTFARPGELGSGTTASKLEPRSPAGVEHDASVLGEERRRRFQSRCLADEREVGDGESSRVPSMTKGEVAPRAIPRYTARPARVHAVVKFSSSERGLKTSLPETSSSIPLHQAGNSGLWRREGSRGNLRFERVGSAQGHLGGEGSPAVVERVESRAVLPSDSTATVVPGRGSP